MSARELSEWAEFFNLEPWGWDADCFKSGIVAATVANVHRDTSKKRTPFEAIDFVPGHVKRPPKMDPKELKAQLQLAFAGMKHAGKRDLHDQGSKGAGDTPKSPGTAHRPKGRRQGVKGRS